MNPCESLPFATAPYYREARVTFAWRQTACQMRHCCARRIVETGSRRKLGCTSTRWAERHPQGVCRIRKASEPPTAAQQRIIEAEASRIAMLNVASLRAGSRFGKHCSSSSCSLAMGNAFLLDGRPVFFLGKENGGRITRHLCRIDIRTCAKKEEFSFEKENIPLSRIPCTVQGKNPSPLKGYHLLPVNKKSAPRFSKTARNIRFANSSPHA